MNITIEMKGWDKARLKIAKLEDFKTGGEFVANTVIEHLKSNVPPYPPEVPGQRYVRTGLLGRSFRTDVHPMLNLISMKLSNVATQKGRYYPPWVISKERIGQAGPQARVHQGRWYTLQEYAKGKMDYVKQEFEAWINSILKS